MKTCLLVITAFTLINQSVNSARILAVFPFPAYSHQFLFRTVLLELNARGHEIVVITTNPIGSKVPQNYVEIDLSFVHNMVDNTTVTNIREISRITAAYLVLIGMDKVVKRMYALDEVQDLIKNDHHFDLVITEWSIHPSIAAFSEHFNCPLIGIRSLTMRVEGYDSVGSPVTPSYQSIVSMDFEDDFLGRLENTVALCIFRLMYTYLTLPRAEEIAKEYFPRHVTYVGDLEKDVSVVFTHTHPLLTGSRPLTPAVVEIGGMHPIGKPNINMSENVQKLLDETEQGAILFSLGSMVSISDIEKERLNLFLEAFSELPYLVLMKTGTDKLRHPSKNIKMFKWLPQHAVLGHPNMRLFITQGGLLSIGESLASHVPMIIVPILADQFANSRRQEELGTAIRLDFYTLSKDVLIRSIQEVITNSSYKQRTIEIDTLLKDQPTPPLEKAMWWFEYVLRHRGARYFKTKAVGMPWYTYYCVDIFLFLLAILSISMYVIRKVVNLILLIIWYLAHRKREKID